MSTGLSMGLNGSNKKFNTHTKRCLTRAARSHTYQKMFNTRSPTILHAPKDFHPVPPTIPHILFHARLTAPHTPKDVWHAPHDSTCAKKCFSRATRIECDKLRNACNWKTELCVYSDKIVKKTDEKNENFNCFSRYVWSVDGEYALKFWRHGYLVFMVAEMFSGLSKHFPRRRNKNKRDILNVFHIALIPYIKPMSWKLKKKWNVRTFLRRFGSAILNFENLSSNS